MPVRSQTGTTSGDFVVEPPTLISLGFEWKIAGDDNRNAHVDATYRKKGEQQWRKALPLMRLQREEIGVAPGPGAEGGGAARFPLFKYTAANMFSGISIPILSTNAASSSPILTASPEPPRKLRPCAPARSLSRPKVVTSITFIRLDGKGPNKSPPSPA